MHRCICSQNRSRSISLRYRQIHTGTCHHLEEAIDDGRSLVIVGESFGRATVTLRVWDLVANSDPRRWLASLRSSLPLKAFGKCKSVKHGVRFLDRAINNERRWLHFLTQILLHWTVPEHLWKVLSNHTSVVFTWVSFRFRPNCETGDVVATPCLVFASVVWFGWVARLPRSDGRIQIG